VGIGDAPQGFAQECFVFRSCVLLISANFKSAGGIEMLLQRICLGLPRRRFLSRTSGLAATNGDQKKSGEDCDARKTPTAAGTHVRQE
jgi:hypothetical protein